MVKELGQERTECKLHSDSKSVVHLAKNSTYHSRTEHIDIKYHFIRSLLEEGSYKMDKIRTDENPADMVSKSFTTEKLEICSTSLGLAKLQKLAEITISMMHDAEDRIRIGEHPKH